MNWLGDFSKFGVLAVLDLVPRYTPANEDEGFQIMNLLNPVLRTTNVGAFMAVIFALLSLTYNVGGEESTAMRSQIVSCIGDPSSQ